MQMPSSPGAPPRAPAARLAVGLGVGTDGSATRPAERIAWSWPDALLAGGLALFALAIRWPHLWTVPRFTDETLEVLHSLAIVRDGARPLVNYDSYYGALYNYLVAGALWLGGESPFVPRVVVLVAGALTVAAAFGLGRELALSTARGSPLPAAAGAVTGGRGMSRAAGVLAALLLATNGAHVVVNSHIAWSNCLTPLFTTLTFWALLRARRPLTDPSLAASEEPARRPARPERGAAGPALALAGLLFGLALQTHPLVAALLPGVGGYVLWHARGLLRTPWPYLGVLLFLVGYFNVLLYNAQSGWDSLSSARRIQAEYAVDQQASSGYLASAGAMLLLLARILGGAVDQRPGPAAYLGDPLVLLGCGLAAVGLVWSARRGQPLPLLITLGFLLLLPALNPKFRTLLTVRYLMPIVPLLFAAAAAWVAHAAAPALAQRAALATLLPWRAALVFAAPVAAGLLVIGSIAPLGRYYARAFERSDTNERIVRLSAEIAQARQADEPVLVDEAIGAELPDTGLTELRGLEYLLQFGRIPYSTVRPTPARLQEELDGRSALAILNARDAAAAAARLVVAPLDARPPAETGRGSDYRLYRLSRGPGQPGA